MMLPIWQSLASFPFPLRNSRASGSVLEARFIRSLLAMEVALSITPTPLRDGFLPLASFGTKALHARPTPRSACHRPRNARSTAARAMGKFEHTGHELGGNYRHQASRSRFLQNTVAIPYRIFIGETDKPAKQQIVVELAPSATVRSAPVERLQQHARSRRSAGCRPSISRAVALSATDVQPSSTSAGSGARMVREPPLRST